MSFQPLAWVGTVLYFAIWFSLGDWHIGAAAGILYYAVLFVAFRLKDGCWLWEWA